jgi:hypothetical protein
VLGSSSKNQHSINLALSSLAPSFEDIWYWEADFEIHATPQYHIQNVANLFPARLVPYSPWACVIKPQDNPKYPVLLRALPKWR